MRRGYPIILIAVCALISGLGASGCRGPALLPPPTVVTPTPFPTVAPTYTPALTPTSTATTAPTPTATPVPTSTPLPSPPPPPPRAAHISLVRGPYLQSVTANSVIVVWETDVAAPGEVVYGETLSDMMRISDPTVSTRHVLTLTGLAPYTRYHYRIESEGFSLGEERMFHTAAGPEQTAFRFVVFGDTRTQHDMHRRVVQGIVAQKPDFVLHTGDLVEYGAEKGQWDIFFEIEGELMEQAPLFPVLGNHEGNHRHYFDLFYLPGNERWYAFDYGNARFVGLQVDGFADYAPGSEQYLWLQETLAANTQEWLFVYFHIPPYTSTQDNYEESVRQALTPLFERYGVDIVFSGHKHNYERNEVGDITYLVTGGGGAPLYPMHQREPTQVAFAMAYHFVLIELEGTRLRATAISDSGEVLDAFERGVE
ncbi:MAG: metallophosphoesterase family protein [Anaerolineae bacterium]|nr:metallophosphoesterase family protein [Anaerolineae bacterium]